MNYDTAFGESADGYVHLLSTSNPEYTLCGDAFDCDDVEPGSEWQDTQKKVVTCPHCIRQILAARGVRIRTK